jgi:hypothetical protein
LSGLPEFHHIRKRNNQLETNYQITLMGRKKRRQENSYSKNREAGGGNED